MLSTLILLTRSAAAIEKAAIQTRQNRLARGIAKMTSRCGVKDHAWNETTGHDHESERCSAPN